MAGRGCRKCAANKTGDRCRFNLVKFLEKSKEVHGDKYNYDKVVYKRNEVKVIIGCSDHGEFKQTPRIHFQGHGCPKCGSERAGRKNALTRAEFITKARETHGDKYNYSKVDYKNCYTPVILICKKHGEFLQTPTGHLKSNCPKCAELILAQKQIARRYTTGKFISLAKAVHGDLFEYDLTKYIVSYQKVAIKCKKHGVFYQMARDHLQGHGCTYCFESRGELRIRKFLRENNFDFEMEKSFSSCRNKQPLKFDFYLPRHNLCIEFDGLQHYIGWSGDIENLEYIQINDQIKNIFCASNNINLLRIPYWDLENVEAIVAKYLQEINSE